MKLAEREVGRPLLIAAAVAVFATAAFLVVEMVPWNREAREPPNTEAIKAAAHAADAQVIPTQPKLSVEPKPLGPKPFQPPVVAN